MTLSEPLDDELLSSFMPDSDDTTERRLPSALSPSSIDTFQQCPRRFEWEKVDRHPSAPGEAAVKGTFVHRALELLMQEAPADRTFARAREHMRTAWDEISVDPEFVQLGLPEADVQQFRRDGWHSVRRYFEMESPAGVDVVATEQHLEATIEGVPIRGIIDRLEHDILDDLVVTDYKNGKVPLPRYRKPKIQQLNFYALLVEAAMGERPVAGRLVFTGFGEVIETTFTDDSTSEALEAATGVWNDMHAMFESEDGFTPSTGPLCGWCPAVAECPEGRAEVIKRGSKKPGSRGSLGSHAPAWRMVDELQAIAAERDATGEPW